MNRTKGGSVLNIASPKLCFARVVSTPAGTDFTTHGLDPAFWLVKPRDIRDKITEAYTADSFRARREAVTIVKRLLIQTGRC